MEYREKILGIIRLRGPSQPLQLSKELATNSTLASAMLSEMTEKGLLKVSSLKVGSSPLYFIPGQEDQLLRYVHVLNEKDRRTLELLQTQKVLRDSSQEPLVRVSLRNLKDFAKPLEVQYNDTSEVFWKWYLLSDNESEEFIRPHLAPEAPAPREQPVAKAAPQKKKRAVQQKLATPAEEPRPQDTPPVAPLVTQPEIIHDTFLEILQSYFAKNNIRVVDQTLVKKKSEFEFTLELPSAVGGLVYYCKAKNKKRINEADLSYAFVQGQLKKLPILFISPGELTKSAKEFATNELKGITFKQI